jgi:hypothetical protein
MELSIIRRNPMQWSREGVKATAPPLRAYHPPLPLRPESNGEYIAQRDSSDLHSPYAPLVAGSLRGHIYVRTCLTHSGLPILRSLLHC